MRMILAALALAVALGAEKHNQLTPQEQKEGYVLLFNGFNLDGWQGNPALWSVRNGAILGSSDGHPVKENTFLIYQRSHADFVLRAEVRLRNGNSGIQFRSVARPGPGWVVTGYQADFSDADERSAWGNFYEEKGRGRAVMKTTDEGWQKARSIARPGDWNHYEIFAQGSRIRLQLNGVVTIDTTDGKAASGVIAIQLHAGEPMQVEIRNVKLKPL